jgi:ABC-2 type transport system ATP-binding protein
VGEVSELLFDGFCKDKFKQLCEDMDISREKAVGKMSDGMRMKTALAAVFARETKCLLLDEPASPLDPLMRDKLCSMIREYLDEGNGEKSVFFSTHNIADMENVTDYCVIMEKGRVVEQGFVEELKEKYVVVKGETEDAAKAERMITTLMGDKVDGRKEFLAKYANFDKRDGFIERRKQTEKKEEE